MNPINDEIIAIDGNITGVHKLPDLDKSIELSNNSSEISNKDKTMAEDSKTEIARNNNPHKIEEANKNDDVNILEKKDEIVDGLKKSEPKTHPDNKNKNKLNENGNEGEDNGKEITEESVNKFKDVDPQEGDQKTTEDKINSLAKDTIDEEEIEDFEEVEDVEIPGEEEVDEIIVPDEAEAEDLTDDKDDGIIDKSLNEEMEDEEGTLKSSEIEENDTDTSLQEEETTKSSEAVEKYENGEDSDKKSFNNDSQEDTCSKDYGDDGDMDNLPIEPELVAIESLKDSNSALEGTKSNDENPDEDTNSQATYDPLNCMDNQEQEQDDEDTDIVAVTENENSLDTNSVTNKDDNVAANDDEDDDEVQFVETRNSPICIESDDDDDANSKNTNETSNSSFISRSANSKQTITTSSATVRLSKNIIVTRTSARKSTAKPPQKQQSPGISSDTTTLLQLRNKPKNFSYLQKATNYSGSSKAPRTQQIVDCIELLDSSDEELAPPRKPQPKTPQKRTLLAAKGNYYKTNNKTANTSDSQRLPNNFAPQIRQQVKKPVPPPLPPPTPQSNFLNAVQLQPASLSGPNPPAFSALLSNKSVIIPNAFYGNPPSVRGSLDTELDRRYARWLENFLNQFCKPQFAATHSCFVFLQRALKYKDFVRIKTLRTNMNSHTQTASNQINSHLMTDLRTIFFKNIKKISNYGRRFCELTCSTIPGKAVALMAHGISGKVTLKTCNMDVPKAVSSAVISTSTSSYASTNSLPRKRQVEEDEDEYTPDKSKLKTKTKPPSENGDEDSGETGDDRKRSLRTKRTKRLDNFSYNEDDLLAEYEIDDEDDEKLAQVEIQRKIEQKRLEAQRQRQQQAKSFENAFIQAFAKSIDGPTTSTTTNKNANIQRIRLKNTTATATNIKQYTANNDAEDLLQATWIENVENDDTQVISDDDEPREHRIYKQQKQQQQQLQQQEYYSSNTSAKSPTRNNTNSSQKSSGRVSKRQQQEEIITGDDNYDENNYFSNSPSNIDPLYWPKNVDPQMHVHGKHKDRCVICNLSCQRLVHHYVNEHRGCEVYNSRLSSNQIKMLKQGKCTISNVSLYKNGQFQYEAFCIFCQKQSRFMLPYWYQHFTMHTGEYAYRCSGCGVRKPTRSLLTQHQSQGCPQAGSVIQDYAHDSKSLQVEARLCTLCNYVQLHRSNIVKHLHLQHNIKQILPKHIQTIVLMKTQATLTLATTTTSSQSLSGQNKRLFNVPQSYSRPPNSYEEQNTYIIEDDDNDVSYEEIIPEESSPAPQANSENHYYNYIPPYMQAAVNSGNFSFEDVDAGDDLSFMICGMLDVQMNPNTN